MRVRGCAQAHTHQHVTAALALNELGAEIAIARAKQASGVAIPDVRYAAVYDSFTITLAMLLEHAGIEGSIDATDVDASALNKARIGIYPIPATVELPATLVTRYLEPVVSEPAALPKYVAILPDLPVTPIGKIYKPALRLLATKYAIESALNGAGLQAAAFEVAASEAETVIHVRNERDAATAKRALQGMPISYDIRQDAGPLP